MVRLVLQMTEHHNMEQRLMMPGRTAENLPADVDFGGNTTDVTCSLTTMWLHQREPSILLRDVFDKFFFFFSSRILY